MGEKVDLKRTLPAYRARRGVLELVDLPEARYLAVDGHGDPNSSPAFEQALAALYPAAYALKFASKAQGQEYVVPPLEALWWSDDMTAFTTARDKSQWSWTLLSLVPTWVSDDAADDSAARGTARAAGSGTASVRVLRLDEGRCVQTLHVGSFDDEAAVLARLHHEFVPQQGLRLTGRHHEIYLTDTRRTAPERRRTILRQPVLSAAADG